MRLLFLIFLAVLPTRTLHALPPLPSSSIKAGFEERDISVFKSGDHGLKIDGESDDR